jgi:hypothetical protein
VRARRQRRRRRCASIDPAAAPVLARRLSPIDRPEVAFANEGCIAMNTPTAPRPAPHARARLLGQPDRTLATLPARSMGFVFRRFLAEHSTALRTSPTRCSTAGCTSSSGRNVPPRPSPPLGSPTRRAFGATRCPGRATACRDPQTARWTRRLAGTPISLWRSSKRRQKCSARLMRFAVRTSKGRSAELSVASRLPGSRGDNPRHGSRADRLRKPDRGADL